MPAPGARRCFSLRRSVSCTRSISRRAIWSGSAWPWGPARLRVCAWGWRRRAPGPRRGSPAHRRPLARGAGLAVSRSRPAARAPHRTAPGRGLSKQAAGVTTLCALLPGAGVPVGDVGARLATVPGAGSFLFLGEAAGLPDLAGELVGLGQAVTEPLASVRRPAVIACLAARSGAPIVRGIGLDALEPLYLRAADARRPGVSRG